MIAAMVLYLSTVIADNAPDREAVTAPALSGEAPSRLDGARAVAARSKRKRSARRKRPRASTAAPTVQAPAETPEETREEGGGGEHGDGEWNVEQLDFDEVETPDNEKDSLFAFDARLDLEHHEFVGRELGDRLDGRDNLEARLGMTFGTSAVFLRAEGDARKDFATPERDRVAFLEAYGNAELGPLSLRVGHQLTAWGATTLVVPGDIIDRIDYRDVVRPEKLASINARAALSLGRLRFELYALPRPTVHRVPFDVQTQLGGEPRAVPMSAEHIQGAARLVLSLPALDVSIAIANIYDHVPVVVVDHATLLARTSQRRLWAVVVDAETTLGKARFALDAVGFEPDDGNRAYGIAVAGIDYRTAQFSTDHSVHLFLEVEAARRASTQGPSGMLDPFRTPFARAVIGRVTYDIGEVSSTSAGVYVDLESGATAVNVTCELRIVTATHVRFGFDRLAGAPNTLFGRYRDDSRVFVELSALF